MAERRATAEDPALRPATDAAFPAGGGPAPVSGPGAAPLAGLPEALPQGDLPVRNSGLIADARSAAMPGKATEAPPTDANGADGAEAPVRRADAVAAAGAVASGVAGAMPSAAPDPAQGQPKAAAEAVPPVVKPDPPPPDAAAGERPALAAAAAVGPNDPGPTQVERAVSDKRTPASDQTLPAPLANPVPARLWQGVFLDARGGPLRPEAPPGDAPAERVARDVAADPARPRPEPGWAVTAAARALALAVIDPLAHAQPDPLGLGEGQVPDGRGLAEAAMGVGSMAGTVGGSTHAVAPGALPQLWSQVAGALARRADGATELTLAPEELGRVRVTLQADEHCADRVVVLLSFDRPETMDLFRRHADQLAAALQAAGYSEASISFAQGGGSEGDGSERMPRMAAEHQDNPAGPPAKPEPSPEPSLLARAGGTSLDLRL